MLVEEKKPEGFKSDFAEVACCVQSGSGKILLLLNKSCDWELPRDKVLETETVDDSALLVLRQKTGLILGREQLVHKAEVFCSPRFCKCHFVCNIWLLPLGYEMEVKLTKPQNLEYLWIEPELALRALHIKWHMQRFIKLAIA